MRALLSVADGAGIAELAQELIEQGIEVYATDPTCDALARAGLEARPISALAGDPSLAGASGLVGGRVRTLHPAVYAGILARRHIASDMADLAERGLASIDIVVVALGSFGPQVGRGLPIDAAVELIDVEALALLAAAARNFGGVAAVCDRADYALLVDELRQHGHVSAEVRQRLAAKAFAALAAYQGEVAAYLDHIGGVRFPEQLSLVLHKERDLPYGENPQQRGALYRETMHRARSLADAERLQGPEPTFNDLIDLDAAFRMASDFASPTCAIVKQRSPVGLSSHDDGREAFRRALSGDPVTAYGAVVAINREVDEAVARELVSNSFEGLVARGFSEGAKALLATRPELAVLTVPAAAADHLPDYGIAELDFHRI